MSSSPEAGVQPTSGPDGTRDYTGSYIGGRWVAPPTERRISVSNPATEAVIGSVPEAALQDGRRAVLAAREAWPSWATTSVAERAGILRQLASAVRQREQELAALIVSEVGTPVHDALDYQVRPAISSLETMAAIVEEYPIEERVGPGLVCREPIGVVVAITPWNFPLTQLIAKVASALAAGCTIVAKPSELAPLSAFVLAEMMESVALSPGVFNLVCGYGPVLGESLVVDEQVDMVSFTGSIRAGARVSALAGETIKRVALELGGKSPAVVLEGVDLEQVIVKTVEDAVFNAGQTCNALTRLLVPAGRHEEAVFLAVKAAGALPLGDPADPHTRIGPVISGLQRERVLDYIKAGQDEGAQLACGGCEVPAGLSRGYYVQPTIFGSVQRHMRIAREEIFGPVLAILPYTDVHEAIEIANDTIYGLSAAVWAGDYDRALSVARLLRAGQVSINGASGSRLLPFGGYRQSGNGREYGRYGLEEYFELKAIKTGPPK